MIKFEDLNFIFSIWLCNTTIKVNMEKKSNLKQQFGTMFQPLRKKQMILVYHSTILVHFTMFAPQYEFVNHPSNIQTL